jgi:hypothetical protein
MLSGIIQNKSYVQGERGGITIICEGNEHVSKKQKCIKMSIKLWNRMSLNFLLTTLNQFLGILWSIKLTTSALINILVETNLNIFPHTWTYTPFYTYVSNDFLYK